MKNSVLIVGAGPVGLALALALKRSGLAPTLVDARPAGAGDEDKRVLALAHGSRQTLEKLGCLARDRLDPDPDHPHLAARRSGPHRDPRRRAGTAGPRLRLPSRDADPPPRGPRRHAKESLSSTNCFIEFSTASADRITAHARDGREFGF